MYNVPTAERNTDKKFPQNFGLMMAKTLCLNKFKSLCSLLLNCLLSPGRCIVKMIGWLALQIYDFLKKTLDQLIVDCRADREAGRREKLKYMQVTRTTSLAGFSPSPSCRGVMDLSFSQEQNFFYQNIETQSWPISSTK